MSTIPKPNLPARWRWQPLDSIAAVSVSTVDKKSYDDESPVRLCNYTDVYYSDNITADIDFMNATASSAQIRQFSVRAGDVPITKDSESSDDIGRPSFVPHDLPGVVYGYHLAIYRPYEPGFSRFLYYLFESALVRAELQVRTPGVTRVGLSQNTLRNLRVPLPERSEAKEIADYLDHETAEIDALVKGISELQILASERFNSHLHSIMAGSPVNVPLRRVAKLVTGGTPPSTLGDSAFTEGGFPWIRPSDVEPLSRTARATKFLSVHGQSGIGSSPTPAPFVVCIGATIGKVGFSAAPFSTNQQISIAVPVRANAGFLYFALRASSNWIAANATGTTLPIINNQRLGDLPVPLLSMTEQANTTAELDHELENLNLLDSETRNAISLARERRTALIGAAVTGQIDVTSRRRGPSEAERLDDELSLSR